MEEKQLTFGEQLCGVRFNPSGDTEVDVIKKAFAELADKMNAVEKPENADGYLFSTIKGHAIRHILDAQMASIKLITLKFN